MNKKSIGSTQSLMASKLNLYIQTTRPLLTSFTARCATRFRTLRCCTRLRWNGSINHRLPWGDITWRSVTAEAPSATPISTNRDLPFAHSRKASSSARVCCPKIGLNPNKAKTGWRSNECVFLSGVASCRTNVGLRGKEPSPSPIPRETLLNLSRLFSLSESPPVQVQSVVPS